MPPSEILDQVSNEELDAKIAQYEAFVNGVLKRDLSKALELKEKYQKSLDDYEALEENIKQLREGEERSLRTLVDLGSGVHCAALVPDTSRIFIRAGLGFHVECDLAIDAPRVIALQKASLKAQLERCLSTIASVRANIRATADGIEQLRRLQR